MKNVNSNIVEKNKDFKAIYYAITFSMFAVIFAISAVLCYYISFEFSSFALSTSTGIAAVICVIFSFWVCTFFPKQRKAMFYFKKLWIVIILLVIATIAVSFAGGMLINAFVGGIRANIGNPFLRGAVLKIPMLILYLLYLYRTFRKFGFVDSGNKEFNLHFRIICALFSFIVILPSTVYDSMYDCYATEALSVNVHTAFNSNIDLYIDQYTVNSNFNIIYVLISILLVMAVEAAVAGYAYNRGKKIFEKEHLRDGTYETYADTSLAGNQ